MTQDYQSADIKIGRSTISAARWITQYDGPALVIKAREGGFDWQQNITSSELRAVAEMLFRMADLHDRMCAEEHAAKSDAITQEATV